MDPMAVAAVENLPRKRRAPGSVRSSSSTPTRSTCRAAGARAARDRRRAGLGRVLTRRKLSLKRRGSNAGRRTLTPTPPPGARSPGTCAADEAFRRGKLRIRGSLHVGVGFLAATSGAPRSRAGSTSVRCARAAPADLDAVGRHRDETIICAHGLGGTKASFLPTVAALADDYRVVALDPPGFGESDKPIGPRTTLPLRALGVRRYGRARPRGGAPRGNSMGGRVAIEAGLTDARPDWRLLLLSPALAWLRDRAPGRRSSARSARARPDPAGPATDRRGASSIARALR